MRCSRVMTPDDALARFAREHHGLFRTADAVALGVSPTMLTTRRQRGTIERIEPRVWRMTGAPREWRQRLLGAAWAERGLASHRAAGAAWELGGCRPGVVEVLTPRWRRRPNASVRVHETTSLHPDDHDEVDGIPTTSVARTL